MATGFTLGSRRTLYFCIIVLAIITAVFALPFQMRTKAAKGLFTRTESQEKDLPNYDIRSDKTAINKLVAFRSTLGKSASEVADERDAMVRGEESLRQMVPTLKVVYNTDIRIPEVIAPEAKLGRNFLTRPSSVKHADILKAFLQQNSGLIGVRGSQAADLKVFADYTNPNGELSFVELDQEINGIPVFRGEVKAGFTRRGEMIRVINNFAPGLDYGSLSTNFGDSLDAVHVAARSINNDESKLDLHRNPAESTDLKAVFGTGDWATTAEKMYFPTEPGVAVPAWRVLIWQPVNAYYVIVDAATGTMLWRKNISADQTQPSSYGVYVNPNAMVNVADNPFPMTPGPTSPNGMQGAPIARTTITRIGNESPFSFNDAGWLADGVTKTDGNAVQAGLDRDGNNGVDPNSEAFSSSRNFVYEYDPFDPNTNTGESPVPSPQTYPGSAYQQGSVAQLFYICNWYHDATYQLGFTEQARNFQNDNFGRGGVGGDRVSAEGQDSSGVNNANFDTPADGARGRMQMYLWTNPEPDIDGNVDADVVIHEHTHGLSNRLHGNGSGLSLTMSSGMGEGWSDFYGHCLLSEPTDPINGIYTTGSYDTYRNNITYRNNYYYGIRRFPKAVMAFTGGPNDRPHNPLTFADADSTQINLNRGAFARGPFGSTTADAVHNLGEIWSSALWEVRAKMIQRLGWEVGNRKILQLVTDGMKLAPLGPTFLTERDAIVAAALAESDPAESAADVSDIWDGFAIRGIGASASIQNVGSASGDTRVTEAFDLPNLFQSPDLTISDVGGGDGDGFPEPGETLALSIPLTNATGRTAANATLNVVGGGSANYGTIENGQTVIKQISFTLPPETVCGTVVTLTLNADSGLGPVSFTRKFAVGMPLTTFTEDLDGVTAPAFPAGWTAVPVAGGINFVTTTNSPDSGANAAFARDPSTVGGGSDLTSVAFPVDAAAATVTFRNKFDTESGWDGGVLEISIAGGAFQDIITAGGTFLLNGYNGGLGVGTNNPLNGRPAWTGDSEGYITSVIRLPAAAAGQSVQLKWRFGADNNTTGNGPNPGWSIDTIQIAGNFNCASSPSAVRSRADFDGDGKTDLSVYRPGDGNWYLNRSELGFTGIHFGESTDIPTPGDFDGDGKADVAVFRPSNGFWYRVNSSDGSSFITNFGLAGDIPQAGDFDGDGKDDIAVFRPSNGSWYWQNSSDGQYGGIQFGQDGDLPAAGDYDGDGKDDVTVFRPSNGIWYRINSGTGDPFAINFGLEGDLPTPADYDGDNRQDIAVFRPSDGNWYRLNSSDGQFAGIHWGQDGDIPVPGDFDGDGKDDQAVYRDGSWFVNQSTAGFTSAAFGLAGDVPIPKKYIP